MNTKKHLLLSSITTILMLYSSASLAFTDYRFPRNIVETNVLWGLKKSDEAKTKTGALRICRGIEQAKTTKKIVALTFDDGPHQKYTREVLEILKKNDIRATFFVIGKNAQYYPEIVKEANINGNIIANHSYSHLYLTNLSTSEIEHELTKTSTIIFDLIQKYPILFRPPYGACSEQSTQLVNKLGFTTITWSDMTNDYDIKQTSEKIADDIVKHAKPGAIIGLHDGGGNRAKTVEALSIIINKLKAEGYEFSTIPEMLNTEAYRNEKTG